MVDKYKEINSLIENDKVEENSVMFVIANKIYLAVNDDFKSESEKKLIVSDLYDLAKKAIEKNLFKDFSKKESLEYLSTFSSFKDYGFDLTPWANCEGFVSSELFNVVLLDEKITEKTSLGITDHDFEVIYFHLKALRKEEYQQEANLFKRIKKTYEELLSTDHGKQLLINHLNKQDEIFKEKIANGSAWMMRWFMNIRRIVIFSLEYSGDNVDDCVDVLCHYLSERVKTHDDTIPFETLIFSYPEKFFAIDNKIIQEMHLVYNQLKPAFNTFYEVKLDKNLIKSNENYSGYDLLFYDVVINGLDMEFNNLDEIEDYLNEKLKKYKKV